MVEPVGRGTGDRQGAQDRTGKGGTGYKNNNEGNGGRKILRLQQAKKELIESVIRPGET